MRLKLAIILTSLLLLPAATAAAETAPFNGTYQVLSARLSEQLRSTAPGVDPSSRPTTSGTNTFSATIDQQPVEEGNRVETVEGVSRGTLGAAGMGSVSAVVHGCDITQIPPVPCTEASSGEVGAGFSLQLEARTGEYSVKVSFNPPWLAFLSFGSPACQALLRAPLGGTQQDVARVPVDTFVSDDPQTFRLAGQQTSNPGSGFSGGADYSLEITILRVGGNLSIRTTPATNVDADGGRWPFQFDAAWSDDPCVTPPANSPAPLAYALIGTDRARLDALLRAPQEGLAGQAGFAPNAFRLGNRANGKRITTAARSERRTTFKASADALHVRNDRLLGPGNGVFYGARIACKAGRPRHEVKRAEPRVLCHNRPTLPGRAYAGLSGVMKAKLTELYGLLRAGDVCFSLSSGFRSLEEQKELHDDWHEKADRSDPADRTKETLDKLCPNGATRGGPLSSYLQCPTGWDGNGRARNGPARPGESRHNVGEAADLKLAFGASTGEFDPSGATRRADVRRYFNAYAEKVAGLCPSPPGDPGHVELPYALTKVDPVTGQEVETDPPRCRFSGAPSRAAAQTTARPRPRRRRGGGARKLAFAEARASAVGRRFVRRSWTDEYIDWDVGRCRGSRRAARCKLTILGSGARPYTCRTEVALKRRGRRFETLLLGRRTRCR